MIKFIKTSLGLFTGGFILFSIHKYYLGKKEKITEEKLIKLVKKIGNFGIHVLFKRYDSNNKLKNQNKEDNIIHTNSQLIHNEENEIDEEQFDSESAQILLLIECEKITKYNLTVQEYYNYLNLYKNNSELKRRIEIILNTFVSFEKRLLPNFNFGKIIPEKYLEIICNIFYINLKKTTKEYYKELDKSLITLKYKDKNEMYNKIYSSFLKKTRNEVSQFFKIENNIDLDIKVALRIYPFYFSIEHSMRKEYDDINNSVNKLITYILNNPDFVDDLINENNPNYIITPVDSIIDFKKFMDKNKLHYCNKPEIEKE
jgi:hypothetical protein